MREWGAERGEALARICAALLAASVLQGCGGANVLAAIDGPYIPPSERFGVTQAAVVVPVPEPVAVLAPVVEPALARIVEPAPEPEPQLVVAPPVAIPGPAEIERIDPSDLAYLDPQFIGPVLTASEMAQLAAAPAVELPPEEQPVELVVAPPAEVVAEVVLVSAAEPEQDAVAAPSRIGRDFLAPLPTEPVEPAAAALVEPAPNPPAAIVSTGSMIGPAEPGPAAPVVLATRPPSAFDFTPPVATPQRQPRPEPRPEPLPAVVVPRPPVSAPAVSAPAEAAPSVSAYVAFHRFAVERLGPAPANGGRRSMLLADPPSLNPALQTCGTRPPAVLIDLDPAGGLLPLIPSNRADPQLAAALADLRTRGVAIYWITGHAPGAASAIRQRLTGSALDPTGDDPIIVSRFASESKQERRRALSETHCLLAILGDQRGDFDELYDYLRDPVVAAPLEIHVDHGWFLAPLPLG